MCIAFTARCVLDYVLNGNGETGKFSSITKENLSKFCEALEKNITAHCQASPHYKYVYYDFSVSDMPRYVEDFSDRYCIFEERISLRGKANPLVGRIIEAHRNDQVVV